MGENTHRVVRSVTAPTIILALASFFTFSDALAQAWEPEVLIYNETGEEMWFYDKYWSTPSKPGGNPVKSTKLPKGKAMLIDNKSLFKWKSNVAFYTYYGGGKCKESGKTKFRKVWFGNWQHRSATSDEKKYMKTKVDVFKGFSSGYMGYIYKDQLEQAEKELKDAGKADWRSQDNGYLCLDNRYSRACMVVVAESSSIKVYEDKGNLWGDACDKQKWKQITYAAGQLKDAMKKANPVVAKVITTAEKVTEAVADSFNDVVAGINNASSSACKSAISGFTSKYRPRAPKTVGPNQPPQLGTKCMESTFKGFVCAAPKVYKEIKDAPDKVKEQLAKNLDHADCASRNKIGKPLCSMVVAVSKELSRPVRCLDELRRNSTLKNLFKTASSSKTTPPKEACEVVGEQAFYKTLESLGIKALKASKKTRIKKLAIAIDKWRKARKARDKAHDKIDENDFLRELTEKNMPHCYGML